MQKFYNLTVKNLYKETTDTSVVEFDIPEQLQESYSFKAGQYLTLEANINGEEVRRSYSLCSSPLDKRWKVAVKQITSGVFSTYVNTKLKIGDTLKVSLPEGNFCVDPNPSVQNNYIAFAAGSGITPMLSIIKTQLLSEPNSSFKLFYLNRTVKSIIFKEEIEKLKNQFFERFQVFYFLTKEKRDIPLLNGRFDAQKLNVLTNTFIDVADTHACFICGPKDMIFLIRDHLEAQGMPKSKIHYELFYSGDVKSDPIRSKILEKKADGTEVTIIDGGKEFHFIMSSDTDNILDAALAAGADLPYACKGGVCSTCKCRVIDGNVEMLVNYALDEKEVSQKLVLSCQAVPTTKKVVVDYDV